MQKCIEVWLHNNCHKIYLSGPFGIFCLYIILTISYLRAQTIETSSLPTGSSRPLFKQIKIFLEYWLYISTVSTFLNIRASYQSASSGFHLLGEIPTGAKMDCYLPKPKAKTNNWSGRHWQITIFCNNWVQ